MKRFRRKHPTASIAKTMRTAGLCLLGFGWGALGDSAAGLVWSELPSLPDEHGFAGAFAGVSGGYLIVAGGANFPDGPPWRGGAKVWHNSVFALESPDKEWRPIGRLPIPLGYGVSVTWKDVILCVGGSDSSQHRRDVVALRWNGEQLENIGGPALPIPLANAAGVIIGDSLYLAGGSESPRSLRASSKFWKLDLSNGLTEGRWTELPPWPGPERILPTMAAQNGKILLVSGARLAPDNDGKATRRFLKDAYAFDPKSKSWTAISGPPAPLVAAPNPGIPLGYADVLFLAGDDGEHFFRQAGEGHPGFPVQLYRYNTVTDRWTEAGEFPRVLDDGGRSRGNGGTFPPVTTPIVSWQGQFVLPSGEIRPAVRTPKVLGLSFQPARPVFGTANWIVLTVYLLGIALIGFQCSRSESGAEGFFLAGRRVPWWAAGLSIFSTMLSAITYLTIPSKAYATDWTLLLVNMTVFAAAPIVAFGYLPVFRKSKVTTIYQYLAARFDRSVQQFGSASFILLQLGRMGIVLFLPALSLAAVTPMNLYACIVLMGILATLYTALGGIKAVVWTDVLQTVVLLGGALAALAIMASKADGGFAGLLSTGYEAGKFRWANWNFNLLTESVLVVLLGGFFTNALVPYTSDQAVVQRYLATPNEAEARRSLWLGVAMVLPATFLFLLLGTGLFVFYRAHPELLTPLETSDQILAWFIADQMPAGLAGLVIAGLFAASMSSLDSSMHSIATTVVSDWWKPASKLKTKKANETLWLPRARRVTFIAGSFGTVSALAIAGMEIQFLWNFTLKMMGLLGGTLAGVMAVGMFLPKAKARHVWAGIVVSSAILILVKFLTPIHSLLYAFFGATSVIVVAAASSLYLPQKTTAR